MTQNLNQLYTFDWLEKDIQNAEVVVQKFILVLTKVINLKRKEDKKKQEVVDEQKAENIAEK